MQIDLQHTDTPPTPAIFTYGFRLFFMAAGVWACIAIGIWLFMLHTGHALPSRFAPLTWHIHEMLFGFVMAAVAGFLLTAIPNWTRLPRVQGALLGTLGGLWLLGRVACMVSGWVPAWVATAADLSFPVVFTVVIARDIIRAGNYRNMVVVMPVALLGIANLLMHLESMGVHMPYGLGWHLALAAMAGLISIIGGRITPNFTRNWLARHQLAANIPAPGRVDALAMLSLQAGWLGWAFWPESAVAGVLLVAAGFINLYRLSRWGGLKTWAEPLLLVLHAGYGWLCVGTGLLGFSVLLPGLPVSAAIHAVTVGAIGTMILAVMTRATRGHTGRLLTTDRLTRLLYLCVTAAALMRIAAAICTTSTMLLLSISGGLWVVAFALFVGRYGPWLVRPAQQ